MERLLFTSWDSADVAGRERIAWAIGRMRTTGADHLLLDAARTEHSVEVLAAVSRALMRLGRVDEGLALLSPREPDALMNFALAAHPNAYPSLLAACPMPSAVLALGVLGDIRAIPILMDLLSDSRLGGEAAIGLHLLTEKAPIESVFVSDPVDMDTLLPEEARLYQEKGQVPTYGEGRPFGQQIVRLSRDPGVWRAHLPREVSLNQRVRAGAAASAMGIAAPLLEPEWPVALRALALDELAIWFGYDPRVEGDTPLTTFRLRLPSLRQEIASL